MELPENCYEVWKWFIDLHNARGSNGMGISPISYLEIDAYFRLMDISPSDWEVSLIRRFDIVAMNSFAEESNKRAKTPPKSKSK